MKSEDHAAFESQMRKYYKRSTSTGVSSMNRETEAVEKWKESELQGTGTVKLGTSDCSSGSHHSGAPDWGCDFHFFFSSGFFSSTRRTPEGTPEKPGWKRKPPPLLFASLLAVKDSRWEVSPLPLASNQRIDPASLHLLSLRPLRREA